MDPVLIFGIAIASLGFIAMATVVISLIKQGRQSRKLSSLPSGMSFRAGGTIKSFTLSYPFVKVSIGETYIEINFAGQGITLWNSVDYKPELTQGLFFNGVKLSLDTNNDTIIWSPFAKLIAQFLNKK